MISSSRQVRKNTAPIVIENNTLQAICITQRPTKCLMLYALLYKIALQGNGVEEFNTDELAEVMRLSKNEILSIRKELISCGLLIIKKQIYQKSLFILLRTPSLSPPLYPPNNNRENKRKKNIQVPPLRGGPIYSKKEKKDSNTFTKKMTIKLYKILKSKNKIKLKPNFTKWEQQFIAIEQLGYTKKQIIQVLNWYKENLRNPYTPKIYNAQMLKLKFQRILDAMERIDNIRKLEIQKEIDRQTPFVDRIDPSNYDEFGKPIPKLGDDGEYYIE